VVTRYAAEPLDLVRPATRARRVAPPLLLAGGLLVASVALHVRDPHQSGSWGYCPWFVLTGTACPGCGGLRAVNDLTRGDVAAALSSNALFVVSLPFLAALWTRSVAHRWRGGPRPLPPGVVGWAGGVALALVLLFWLVRNLPFAGYLAP
jgi:hypothetical protein